MRRRTHSRRGNVRSVRVSPESGGTAYADTALLRDSRSVGPRSGGWVSGSSNVTREAQNDVRARGSFCGSPRDCSATPSFSNNLEALQPVMGL